VRPLRRRASLADESDAIDRRSGGGPLVEALLERGVDREAIHHHGANALHWAMREASYDERFERGPFAALYELLAPVTIDINIGNLLVRVNRHLSEYFLFQTLWALFQSRFTQRQRRPYGAFDTQVILDAWEHLPANVVKPERNRRTHLSGVLSRNEVDRDYAYNRALFTRVAQGWYQFNPKLMVRRKQQEGDGWVPVYQALNLPFIAEFAFDFMLERVDAYLDMAALPRRGTPIASASAIMREGAAQ
jgi:hypothetical protein